MSVSDTDVKQLFDANGVTTTFAIPFAFIEDEGSDFVKVYTYDEDTGEATLKAITTDYTLSPNNANPTSVVFVSAPADGLKVLLIRQSDYVQETEYEDDVPFPASTHEAALDRIVLMLQELKEKADRSLRFNVLNGTSIETEIRKLSTGGALLQLSDDLDAIEEGPTWSELEDLKDDAETAAAAAQSAQSAAESSATAAANSATAAASSATDSETAQTAAEAAQAAAEAAQAAAEAAVASVNISGGTTGEVLTKQSNADGDYVWQAIDALPSGGTTGQVLAKQSNADGDADWIDPVSTAADVTFSPTGSIASTDVQAALAELDGDVAANATSISDHLSDTSDAHDASAISFSPTGGLASTDVQAALAELDSEKAPTRAVSTFNGTSITPTSGKMDETFVYNAGSAQTFSTTGFGTISSLTNGYQVKLIGSSNTNTITIDESDISDGRIMTGPIELGRGMVICFEYNSTLARMVELYRSANNG